MRASPHIHLSRRERQIMDVVYAHGPVTVREVVDQIPDPPSYSAVRAMLRILEEKGHLKHEQDGPRYTYSPVVPREEARDSAMKQMLRTFFDGSAERAVAALLDMRGADLSDDELKRLAKMIEQARKEGR
ncbi:MAG: BlaI/MecI/CopY family transcriptional regulator [Gemmatimonadota bacterium]|nr:MAG: BlaI/MecI/CopY family transcriptional regulator [Gemmatimonadota bacterium]